MPRNEPEMGKKQKQNRVEWPKEFRTIELMVEKSEMLRNGTQMAGNG